VIVADADPERWLEGDALDDRLRGIVRAAAEERVGAGEIDRLRARIEPLFDAPASPSGLSLAPKIGLGLGSLAVIAATLVALSIAWPPPERTLAEKSEKVLAPAPEIAREAHPAPIEVQEPAPIEPPRAIRSMRRRAEPPTPNEGFAEELELSSQIQRALISDPERALSLADEHARRFPSGMLIEEREANAIDALSRLGRAELARERAAAFDRRFARSSYRARIARSLGRLP
jgi:hypothetical protein